MFQAEPLHMLKLAREVVRSLLLYETCGNEPGGFRKRAASNKGSVKASVSQGLYHADTNHLASQCIRHF